MTNGLPEKLISLSFFTCLSLMPWWKVSDISREEGVYTLSYSSFNIKSKSLSLLPESFHVQVFCSHAGFLRSLSQNIPLFETGRSHQPTFSSKHQMCNIVSWYRSFCIPRRSVCTCVLHFVALTDCLCSNTNASFQQDPSHMLNVRLLPSNSLSQGSRTWDNKH